MTETTKYKNIKVTKELRGFYTDELCPEGENCKICDRNRNHEEMVFWGCILVVALLVISVLFVVAEAVIENMKYEI